MSRTVQTLLIVAVVVLFLMVIGFRQMFKVMAADQQKTI